MFFNLIMQIHPKQSIYIIYYQIIVPHPNPKKFFIQTIHIIHIFQLVILFNFLYFKFYHLLIYFTYILEILFLPLIYYNTLK